VAIVLAQNPNRRLGNPNFLFVNTSTASKFVECQRQWIGSPANEATGMSGYRVMVGSQAECVTNRVLRASQFEVGAGSFPGPHFYARSLVRTSTRATTMVKGFECFIAFDMFGEYNEGGTTPGFNPADGDVRIWNVSLFNGQTPLFTPIVTTKTPIIGGDGTDDNSVYSLSFSSVPGIFATAPTLSLTFTLDITPVVTQFGFKVLTPNSFKLTIDADGIVFQDPATPGGAYLGTYLLTVKDIADIVRSNTSVTMDAPGIASNTSSNIPINSGPTDPDAGFFWFENTMLGNVSGQVVTVVAVRDVTEDKDFPLMDQFIQAVARRIHISTTNKLLPSIEWDPNVGVSDSDVNAGSALVSSFVVILFALLVLFL
jgi:hypothetical protein